MIVILVVWALCAFFCWVLAYAKGLNTTLWGWAALLLGPLAFLAVIGMPDKSNRR